MTILRIALWCMITLPFLYMFIAVKGPSIWDRLLALNLIAVKVTIIIILLAAIYESTFLLDVAIIYTLSGFIGTIFIALFFSKKEKKRRRVRKKGASSLWRVY